MKFKEKLFKLFIVFLSLILCLNFIIVAEFIFDKFNYSNGKTKFSARSSFPAHFMDESVGWRYRSNLEKMKHVRIDNRKIIWAYDLSTDNYDRRITIDHGKRNKRAALFFGCSFVEGMGLNDDETITSKFALFQNEFRPYNYGFSGYGPHQMLAMLEKNKIGAQISEEVGIGFYIFINDHYRRILGATGRSFLGSPVYSIQNEELSYKGTFSEIYPIKNILYQILEKSEIFRFINGRLPTSTSKEDEKLFCEIIKKSKSLFEEQFPKSKFYIVNYDSFGEGKGGKQKIS